MVSCRFLDRRMCSANVRSFFVNLCNGMLIACFQLKNIVNALNLDEIITFHNDIISFVTFVTQELLSHCKTGRNCG